MGPEPAAIDRVAAALGAARSVGVLTGAGISAESGLPTFRGPEGLWRNVRAEDLATPEAFARDPGLVWEWYRWRQDKMASVTPNPGHFALASLEPRFEEFTLVTQNVDGLHGRAGSRRVLELHGNIWRVRCSGSRAHRFTEEQTKDLARGGGGAVPVCPCGAPLRPDVVWFGEPLDAEDLAASAEAARGAEVLLVVGTSSVVYPAAALPLIARDAGALVVEVNPEETALTSLAHVVLRGTSGALLPELERRSARMRG